MDNPYKYIVVYRTAKGVRKATDTKTLEQAQRYANKRRPCSIYNIDKATEIYI